MRTSSAAFFTAPPEMNVVEEAYAPARRAYREAKAADKLTLIAEPESEEKLAEWFLRVLK